MNPRFAGWGAAVFCAAAASAWAASPRAWVEKSNADAQVLLRSVATFSPEQASGWGLADFDGRAADLGPDRTARLRASNAQARRQLEADLADETDPHVRQDLQIMLDAAQLREQDALLDEKYLIPYGSAGRLIFGGIFSVLNEQTAASRHPAAVERLRRYTGLEPGTRPVVEEIRARFEEKLGQPGLLGPYAGQVKQDIADTPRFAGNVRQLFQKAHLLEAPQAAAAEEALGRLAGQLTEFDGWLTRVVLPHARRDFRVPEELYAQRLRDVGLDVSPDAIIAKAELEFAEVTGEMQSLAPLVAAAHGWTETDYRAVIHRLKQDQLPRDRVEAYYRGTVIPRLEALIREHRVATLPDRPMAMRIASDGETAIQPAPHMQPPVLIDNHGELGTFVLPLGLPPGRNGRGAAYDDFTFKAGTWTLTAHEGRPGHELQFARMVEQGVSQARAIFAFNSVNVEGWALYCESEMKPYEPLDAQLIVLQLRLLRAVRAFSDPMLNLGRMDYARAHSLLVDDVCLSEAFAQEELDRFTFRNPGQATSYFYGYSRLLELRAAAQIALGSRFDRLAFNDFIVDQGLLPPNLLADAVKRWSAEVPHS